MSNESSAKTNASAMHTPGPWLISTPNSNEYTRGVHGAQIGDDFSFVICDLADDGYPENEREENARLIAAAPALYAALVDICEWCENAKKLAGVEPYGLAVARAALALAGAKS
jgi:hypothetical protein